MMRSLYSGISGLKNHQTRMDVIGNNIANVNTVGYKTSRTIFQDIFSQTAKSGARNSVAYGGTNPVQIGLGIKLSTIDIMHTPAPIARTDNPFDMMISGDGFFIVGYVELDPAGDPILDINGDMWRCYYTRAGNFTLDDEGYLTTSDGYYVLGYSVDLTLDANGTIVPSDDSNAEYEGDPTVFGKLIVPDPYELDRIRLRVTPDGNEFNPSGTDYDPQDPDTYVDLLGFSVDDNGVVSVIIGETKVAVAKIALGMFSNFGGLEKAGNSLYRETPSSGPVVRTEARLRGSGPILGGGLEMSNVDLATEFTDMIVTQRGFQANSRVITVSDTLLEELVNLKR